MGRQVVSMIRRGCFVSLRALRQAGSQQDARQLRGSFKLLAGSRAISVTACEKATAVAEAQAAAIPDQEQLQAGYKTAASAVESAVTTVSAAPDKYVPTYADSSWYGPFDGMEMLLEYMHNTTGMEWPIVIVGVTVAARVVMLPVMVSVMKNSQRLQRIQPQVQSLSDRMKEAASTDPALMKSYQDELQQLFKTHDCHPIKSLRGIVFQAPVFMSFFFAIRRIAESDPSFAVPFMHLPSLAEPDPMFILPVATSATMLLAAELGADGQQVQNNPMAKNVMRAFSVAIIPATSFMPSGLFCYWLTSTVFSLGQMTVLKVPPIRDSLGLLPPMPSDPKDKGPQPVRFMDLKPKDVTNPTDATNATSDSKPSRQHKPKKNKKR